MLVQPPEPLLKKTAPDYAKIFLHTGRALTLDFSGIGFLVGLWADTAARP
jgi:hypothetical protein